MFSGGYLNSTKLQRAIFLPRSPVLSQGGDKGHFFEETTCPGAYMWNLGLVGKIFLAW